MMTKLDMACEWVEGMLIAPDPGNANNAWVVWSEDETDIYTPEGQENYVDHHTQNSNILLEGVMVDDGEIISIDDFEILGRLVAFSRGFNAWLRTKINIAENRMKPEQIKEFFGDVSTLAEHDAVNSPNHYQLDSGKELKDVYPELLGKESTVAGYKQAVIKYLMRYQDKNGAEDLDKAIQYIEFIKELEYGGAK